MKFLKVSLYTILYVGLTVGTCLVGCGDSENENIDPGNNLFVGGKTCQGLNCGTNGYCDNGICMCITGYAGASCEIQLSQQMALIPDGCFDMGDPFGEGYPDELPVHMVNRYLEIKSSGLLQEIRFQEIDHF